MNSDSPRDREAAENQTSFLRAFGYPGPCAKLPQELVVAGVGSLPGLSRVSPGPAQAVTNHELLYQLLPDNPGGLRQWLAMACMGAPLKGWSQQAHEHTGVNLTL